MWAKQFHRPPNHHIYRWYVYHAQWLMTLFTMADDPPSDGYGLSGQDSWNLPLGSTTSVNWLNLQVFRNHRFWLSLYRTTAAIIYGFQDVGISFHPLMIFWFGSHICNLNFQQMAGVHQPGLLAKMVGFLSGFSTILMWEALKMSANDWT